MGKQIKRILFLVCLIVVVVITIHSIQRSNSHKNIEFNWPPYDEAQLGDKNILFFSMKHCPYCKDRMNMLCEPEIVDVLSDYKYFYVQKEEVSKDLLKRYNINGYPKIIMVDSLGNELRQYNGGQDKDQFIYFLKSGKKLNELLAEIEGKGNAPADTMMDIVFAAYNDNKFDESKKWALRLKERYPDIYMKNESKLLPYIVYGTEDDDESMEISQQFISKYGYCNDYAWGLWSKNKRKLAKDNSEEIIKVYEPYVECDKPPMLILAKAITDSTNYDLGREFDSKLIKKIKDTNILHENEHDYLIKYYYAKGDLKSAREYVNELLADNPEDKDIKKIDAKLKEKEAKS